MKYRLIPAVLAATIPGTARAQQLPIPDGAYVTQKSHCEDLKQGTLDMLELEVTNAGRSFGMPSTSCQVARADGLRSNRYHFTADCIQVGEAWVYGGVLDIVSPNQIRLDGLDHYLCEGSTYQAASPPSSGASDIEALIERWADENGQCRGGSGDDPATDEACARREAVSAQLNDQGMCYGRDGEAGAEHDWHECGPNSVR